ncbi:Uncharacterized protein PECH_006078 [Penicillium ucsense]|uniref:Mediator of RNA polymerase II transcription subunit 4 n=1 Tax=Penicillium ucsense TaxID=2839758 RepID=A0A8J8W2P7_9EURO|nr:Uncharacterized protein PECM_007258 [Penicillium ucsense]KAF7735835.1 Uncharacterized protein PECH_006078 [Penicillium ucsense]
MNALMQSSLNEVESKLNTLLKHLTSSPGALGAPAAAVSLLEADDTLTSSIQTLRLHQDNYAKILQLRSEADRLEERVKNIVRDLERFDKEIREACGDDDDEDSSSDWDTEDESGSKRESAVSQRTAARKEIDYRLLLDFARRISKYNQEAAADVAKGLSRDNPLEKPTKIAAKDQVMTGTNGETGTAEDSADPVTTLTKEATQWLDDSANLTREANMLPYPAEDRIRMGVMGKMSIESNDPDTELEKMLRSAEGLDVAEASEPLPPPPTEPPAHEPVKPSAPPAGTSAAPAAPRPAPAPKPKPKATLDLDLYDPDDDDF